MIIDGAEMQFSFHILKGRNKLFDLMFTLKDSNKVFALKNLEIKYFLKICKSSILFLVYGF